MLSRISKLLLLLILAIVKPAFADNQTATVSPILPSTTLPFQVAIEQVGFSLPNGIHSYASAIHQGKWLFLAGRTNGLHGFDPGPNNFPPSAQNTVVYVVDIGSQTVSSKDLTDPSSNLTQHQIDLLSVTSPQSFQKGNTLYITGGYGVDTASGTFSTKDVLTAIDIGGLIHWVTEANPGETAAQYIRQTSHPLVQVTGGYMTQLDPHSPYMLVFGQNFTGYYTDGSNGEYTQQVRCFQIIDDGKKLLVLPQTSVAPNPNYRRRDLNVVPIMQKTRNSYQGAYVALSGVFTISGGAWTVPVTIYPNGTSFMPDPNNMNTFKQGMNNYTSPTISLFSKATNDMFITLLGGISYQYFQGGVIQSDSEFPFINQVTTIKIDSHGNYSQYLMDNEYPVILSTGSNPGNQLLFGAGAAFIPADGLPTFSNGVLVLDNLHPGTVLGYIVGGIQSTLPNTNTQSDSAASPYIFKVTIQ